MGAIRNGDDGNGGVVVTPLPSTILQDQIHDLRLDLRRLQPKGFAGNILFWWLYPVKFVGDAVLEVTENVVPKVASVVIPSVSNPIASLGLNFVATISHAAFHLTAKLGLVSSNSDRENIRTLSTLMSLADLSTEAKQHLLRSVHEELGKQQFLLGVYQSSAKSFMKHPEELLTMLWEGYGALFQVRMYERKR
jgi:hypothetical protein